MGYQIPEIAEVAELLKRRIDELENKADVLKATELKALYDEIKMLPPEQRASFGKEVNTLKMELQELAESQGSGDTVKRASIDVTAPFDINTPEDKRPRLLTSDAGSRHPIMKEIEIVADIFYRMGFMVESSRLIDDEYHMFDSLNFPPGHPARDDYDSFVTQEGFIAPAHTSTMQNSMLKKYKPNLDKGAPIAVLIPDRVFRNEDLDARHEHTFYQHEGLYVDKNVHAGMLIATLKTFFQEYYQKELEVKTQPFYFPFTEPSFEFASTCVFCDRKGCNVCSYSGWIELGGCGMIHPNVLRMAGIDPAVYTGFAWGFGVERPIMIKYGIEDIRHFNSGKLDFLGQFK
jgi:phenylalanyl-tRNA synthetase alpha chain